MKSIMEENKIVQNFTILLYSRIYETLYLEIYHSENKNLLSKHIINTSQYVTIQLGLPLSGIQMMVKKSQQSMQILNQFKFKFEDFCNNSTVEHMDHYIKLKKKFPQYSLLFQIFYQIKSTTSSLKELQKEEYQMARLCEIQRKKQFITVLKDITKSNLMLLGFKAVNQFFDKQARHKNSLPSDQSLGKKGTRKPKAHKTAPIVEKPTKSLHKLKFAESIIQKQTEIDSQLNQTKLTINHQYLEKNQKSDDKNKANLRKSHKKSKIILYADLTYNQNDNRSQSNKKKKSSSIKKIVTFQQQISEIKNHPSNSKFDVLNFAKVHFNFKQQSQQKIQKKETKILKQHIKQQIVTKSPHEKKSNLMIVKHLNTQNNNLVRQSSHEEKSFTKQFSSIKRQNSQNHLISKLRKLCQQRPNQKITNQQKSSLRLKFNFTEPSVISLNQSQLQNFSPQSPFKFTTSIKRKKRNFNQNQANRESFFQKVYEKTRKSIQRQNELINFVKNQCLTDEIQPKINKKTVKMQQKENSQDLKITNTSTLTNESVLKQKSPLFKKIKNQNYFLSKYKTYLKGQKVEWV